VSLYVPNTTGSIKNLLSSKNTLQKLSTENNDTVIDCNDLNAFEHLTDLSCPIVNNLKDLNMSTLIKANFNKADIYDIDGAKAIAKNLGITSLEVPGGELSIGEAFATEQVRLGRESGSCLYMRKGYISKTIKYGTSMQNPTEQESAQGYQIV
jgi:hypothetical protein